MSQDEDRFEVHPTSEISDCVEWLRQHDYVAALIVPPRTNDVYERPIVRDAQTALLIRPIDMPMEPPLMVVAGDVLKVNEAHMGDGIFREVVVIERA